MKAYVKHDRAARTRTAREKGHAPTWDQGKWRITRDRHAGGILDQTEIDHDGGQSDFPWIYEFPDGKGIRDIATEFWYQPADPSMRDIRPGEWKRMIGDAAAPVPEQILFTGGHGDEQLHHA